MKFTFERTYKKTRNNEVSLVKTKEELTSLTFDQLRAYPGSVRELQSEVNKYIDLVSKKRVAPIFKDYERALEKEVTPEFTQEQKDLAIAALEEKYDFLTDISKIPQVSDKRLTKMIQRKKINTSVRDTDDSIADLAKWNSILTSTILAMYDTFTATQKNKIPPEQRALIETASTLFRNTQTAADIRLANEGASLIERVLRREAQIGKIIKGEE